MISRIILGLMLILSSLSVHALEGKTIITVISGDWHFTGPTYQDGEIERIEDQAWKVYEQMMEIARKDELNNHIIFFDPKKSGNIFNGSWVKLYAFKKGIKERFWTFNSEVDMNSLDGFKKIKEVMDKSFGEIQKKDKVLYYYGEHFSYLNGARIDASSSARFSGGMMKMALELLGGFNTVFMQTCDVNTAQMISHLLEHTSHLLVPHRRILNTPLKLEKPFGASSLTEFRNEFINNNKSHEKYFFIEHGKGSKDLLEDLEKIKTHTDKEEYRKTFDKIWFSFDWIKEMYPESFETNKGSYFIAIGDYLALLSQIYIGDEDNLMEFEEYLYSKDKYRTILINIDY